MGISLRALCGCLIQHRLKGCQASALSRLLLRGHTGSLRCRRSPSGRRAAPTMLSAHSRCKDRLRLVSVMCSKGDCCLSQRLSRASDVHESVRLFMVIGRQACESHFPCSCTYDEGQDAGTREAVSVDLAISTRGGVSPARGIQALRDYAHNVLHAHHPPLPVGAAVILASLAPMLVVGWQVFDRMMGSGFPLKGRRRS